MPRARKKPIEIEYQEFRPEQRPWPQGVIAEDGDYFVYNSLHDSKIHVKPGDMVRQDDPMDRYPIDRETFEKTYEVIE